MTRPRLLVPLLALLALTACSATPPPPSPPAPANTADLDAAADTTLVHALADDLQNAYRYDAGGAAPDTSGLTGSALGYYRPDFAARTGSGVTALRAVAYQVALVRRTGANADALLVLSLVTDHGDGGTENTAMRITAVRKGGKWLVATVSTDFTAPWPAPPGGTEPAAARRRDDALRAAEADAVVLNTADYRTIPATLATWRPIACGLLAAQLGTGTTNTLTDVRQQRKVISSRVAAAAVIGGGPVPAAGAQREGSYVMNVLVLLDSTISTGGGPAQPGLYAEKFELHRFPQGWRVNYYETVAG